MTKLIQGKAAKLVSLLQYRINEKLIDYQQKVEPTLSAAARDESERALSHVAGCQKARENGAAVTRGLFMPSRCVVDVCGFRFAPLPL